MVVGVEKGRSKADVVIVRAGGAVGGAERAMARAVTAAVGGDSFTTHYTLCTKSGREGQPPPGSSHTSPRARVP